MSVQLDISKKKKKTSKKKDLLPTVEEIRKFSNLTTPVFACDSCAFASSCPQFRQGFECAFAEILESYDINSEKDLLEAIDNLATLGMNRLKGAFLAERLSGNITGSSEVNEMMKQLAFLIEAAHRMHKVSGIQEDRPDKSNILLQIFTNNESTAVNRASLANLVAIEDVSSAPEEIVEPIKEERMIE